LCLVLVAPLVLLTASAMPCAAGVTVLAQEEVDDPTTTGDEEKSAREKRLEEYRAYKARKQEEKEAYQQEKAATRAQKEQEKADQRAADEAAAASAAATTTAATTSAAPVATTTTQAPKDLARVVGMLRQSQFAREDPEFVELLDRIDRGRASAWEIGNLAGFLAENGALDASTIMYEAALARDGGNITLWLNYGTVSIRNHQLKTAKKAFESALQIDPINAQAHYNLGTVYLENRDFNNAMDSYTTALILDPDLGDPSVNPQAVNNELLVPVKMMLYRSSTGSRALPLQELPVEGSGND
jgi:tetratricopeptide (TPR) repeat protein